MKTITVFFALSALLSIYVANVESSSPRKCPPQEECGPCEAVDCRCGQYKDECDCCDVCMKCEGERCSILESDVCEEGFTCGDPNRDYLEQIHNPATCIRAIASPEL